MKRTEFVNDWLEALRSGEYKQGRDALKNGDRYCCLGVAGCMDGVALDEEINFAYSSIRDLLGVDIQEQRTLTGMNDNGATFDQIADYVETHLLKGNHV